MRTPTTTDVDPIAPVAGLVAKSMTAADNAAAELSQAFLHLNNGGEDLYKDQSFAGNFTNPRGPSNPGRSHVNFAERGYLYIAFTALDRGTGLMKVSPHGCPFVS